MTTPRPGKGKPFAPGTYSFDGHMMALAADGKIVVKRGDTVSGYSACLYHDPLMGWEEYGKDSSGTVRRLDDPAQISVGQPIYHIPTWVAGQGAPSPTPQPNVALSSLAQARMVDLYKHHDHEVGSEYPGDKSGKNLTDCITFVRNVLSYAYRAKGRPDVASEIWTYTEGMPLATFLRSKGWKVHYWNPDVRYPRDGHAEHPASYQTAVRTGRYYNLQVDGFVVDYNLNIAQRPKNPPPRSNITTWARLVSQGQFAYGLARGGFHTFLFSYGSAYEVHWDQIGDKLYEKSSFLTFAWLSGLLLTPPDSAFRSEPR